MCGTERVVFLGVGVGVMVINAQVLEDQIQVHMLADVRARVFDNGEMEKRCWLSRGNSLQFRSSFPLGYY